MSKQVNVMPQSEQTSRTTRPRIIASIPAYNEEQFIAEVVVKARKFVDKVIVVNDGSTDNTSRVAEAAGASVITHQVRCGAGGATKSCFEAARAEGADVLVTLDGDNQHNADEIPKLVAPILRDKADLVIGSRFLEEQSNMPRYRKFGITVINWLFNFGSGGNLSDTLSCFRAYGERALRSLNITEQGFGFSVELLVQARRKGLAISEVPISCIYHSASHSTNPVTQGLKIAFAVIKVRFINRRRRLIHSRNT